MFFAQEAWNGRMYLDGWVEPGRTITVNSPATGEEVAKVADAGAEDVARAVDIAKKVQAEWGALPATKRSAIMRRASNLLEQHADILAGWLMDEAGSAEGKARFEAGLVAGEFDLGAATAMMPYGQLLQTAKPRLSMTRRKPVGVVAVISPFNFPAILAMRSVAPALALGNAVILKPDPRTSVSGGLFFAALLEEAGLPKGLFSVLPGGSSAGAALLEHPDVPIISFTGSTAAGRAIAEQAGRLLKRVHLELGVNNALVVLEGADVDAAASAGAWGSFLHQGQICMTSGRHIVHESLYEDYVAKLAEKARNLRAGDPRSGTPLGPIIDDKQRDNVHRIVTASLKEGAKLEAGGEYEERFYQPTVLSGLSPENVAFASEIFGPVAPVMKYTSEEELVKIVNGSEYGLSIGVLGGDAFKAFELAQRFNSGIVHINDQTVDDESQAPFGGTKASGTGARFGGHEANIEAFTDTQWLTIQGEIATYPF